MSIKRNLSKNRTREFASVANSSLLAYQVPNIGYAEVWRHGRQLGAPQVGVNRCGFPVGLLSSQTVKDRREGQVPGRVLLTGSVWHLGCNDSRLGE